MPEKKPVDDIAATLDMILDRWGEELSAETSLDCVMERVSHLLSSIVDFDRWLYSQAQQAKKPRDAGIILGVRAMLIGKIGR